MSSEREAIRTQAILLDIEGTTTPVSYVLDVLFPYVRTHLRAHLEEHADDPEYQAVFNRLGEEHDSDPVSGDAPPRWTGAQRGRRLESIAGYVEWLMDRDRKSTGLKELQGRMWEAGYRRGELVAPVFPDVMRALERWKARHLVVGIFSSGSVLAQQLLFRHSTAGDLGGFLSHYFDTTTGPKTDPSSYQRIAFAMSLQPAAIMFASDVTRELDAARSAGMQTRLAVRPGNVPLPPGLHGHRQIQSFDEL